MAAKKTLEENFTEIETIISNLQSADLSLEESFKQYTEGMKLVKNCTEAIDKVEKKLIVLEEE